MPELTKIEKSILESYSDLAFSKGWTLTQAAKEINCDVGLYSNMQTGKRRPSIDVLKRMVEVQIHASRQARRAIVNA